MGSNDINSDRPSGMLGDLDAEEPWPRPEHADLLSRCDDHVRLLPDSIPELIEALDLQRDILNIALSRLVNEKTVEAIEATRAFQLVSALRVELKALASGTKSAALQPNIHGQLRNYKNAHPDYLQMKDEAAAAVQILVEAGDDFLRGDARELVASTLALADVSFSSEAIRAWEDELKAEGRYTHVVHRMAYTLFPGLPTSLLTDEGEPTDPLQAVKSNRKPAEVMKIVKARLCVVALVAARLRPARG